MVGAVTHKIKVVTILFYSLFFVSGCNADKEENDEEEVSSSAPTSSSSGSVQASGTLAVAFPADAAIELAFAASTEESSSLALSGTADVSESKAEKDKRLSEIFSSSSIGDCVQLATERSQQPSCFAPNLKRDEWSSSYGDYVVSLGGNVQQLLYGDGGIVKEAEGTAGESCTASTINYFLGSAVATIDRGREVFAGLVCMSQFLRLELPEAGETKDYLSAVKAAEGGSDFTAASISRDSQGNYTSKIGYKIDKEEYIWAAFVHNPSKPEAGNAIAFHSGQQDALTSANSLQDPPPQGGGKTTNAVAVVFDGGTYELMRAQFKSSKHPADYMDSDGRIDFVAIATEDSGNNLADNWIHAYFNQPADTDASDGGKGIVAWAASASDGYWRSFAYKISKGNNGQETAESIFGFEPSWDSQQQTVDVPAGPDRMYCAWAQGGNPPSNLNVMQGEDGLSGAATYAVQYQVSIRSSQTDVFKPDADESYLAYTVGESDCGANSNMPSISNGATDRFTIPSFSVPDGLSLDSALNANNIELGF